MFTAGFNLPGPKWEGLDFIPSNGDCQMKWGKKSLVLSVATLFLLTCVCSAQAQGRRSQGPGQQPGWAGWPRKVVPVAALAALAWADPGMGGPGMGGPGMGGMGGMGFFGGGAMSEAMLLAREDVQKELELVDDQIEQLGKLRDSTDMREMFGQLRRPASRGTRGQDAGAHEGSSVQDAEVAGRNHVTAPERATRAVGPPIPNAGWRAGQSEDVAKKLGISDEQRDQLRTQARDLKLHHAKETHGGSFEGADTRAAGEV